MVGFGAFGSFAALSGSTVPASPRSASAWGSTPSGLALISSSGLESPGKLSLSVPAGSLEPSSALLAGAVCFWVFVAAVMFRDGGHRAR